MSGRAILIVEDDPDVREVLAGFLQDAGHVPLTASSGGAALVLLRAMGEPPALILTDLGMPGLQGLALLDALHESTKEAGTPVVVLSGSADFEPREHGTRGVVARLRKPVDIDALLALVARWSA